MCCCGIPGQFGQLDLCSEFNFQQLDQFRCMRQSVTLLENILLHLGVQFPTILHFYSFKNESEVIRIRIGIGIGIEIGIGIGIGIRIRIQSYRLFQVFNKVKNRHQLSSVLLRNTITELFQKASYLKWMANKRPSEVLI